MSTFEITERVGDVVVRNPALSRVFEQARIDYCCGGKRTLEQACRSRGLEPASLVAALEEAEGADGREAWVDAAAMGLAQLADHVEATHHAYLRAELPRLDGMTAKVASVHGDAEPRLRQVREVFIALAEELSSHMVKEERILFPMIRRLEASQVAPQFHCGTLANPIRQMELEHDQAGAGLDSLRELTDGYAPPAWACNTYRALLEGLSRLEADMHQHVHKENNVLFPRAVEMEAQKQAA